MNRFWLRTSSSVVLALVTTAGSLTGCTVSTTDGRRDDYVEGPSRREPLPPPGPVDVDVVPPPAPRAPRGPAGDVGFTVGWSIEGSTDPLACADYAAAYAHIVIEDEVGLVDEAETDCEAFAYDSPPLPPGAYYATVTLLDDLHDEVSESIEADVVGADDLAVVDFDASSFL